MLSREAVRKIIEAADELEVSKNYPLPPSFEKYRAWAFEEGGTAAQKVIRLLEDMGLKDDRKINSDD